ncbi:hypothetical protein CASFOL_035371 [Castilleja foliolosa]|uniref:BSD domain-containing protein n=1 Tax=Castilleja foliolosa TaxID=1961234 RepID=A0ABD3BT53_9LAMI
MDAAYSWLRRSASKLKKTTLPPSSATATAATHSNSSTKNKPREDDEKIYGITDQLIEFVKSFTLETFNNFYLPDEEEIGSDGRNSGNVMRDLSEWQETHAMLALSRVKELAQLRFRLCPRYLKERQFWRIYFTLVRSYVTEYELQAVKLAKLKQMKTGDDETVSNINNVYEVEMSEAKFTTSEDSATSMEQK